MADNIQVTAGAGTILATDSITADSSHAQVMKVAVSADGDRTLIPATSANGLTVDVTRVTGNVTVVDGGTTLSVDDGGASLGIDDNGDSITVDAPVTAPVFVRLSNGSSAITALPITDNSGSVTVDDGGTSLTVDGAVTVTGTATVTQGTAAAVASGWPVKVTDGTDTVGISTVSAAKAMKVDLVQSVGLTVGQQDKTGFTEGTTKLQVVGGVYNETIGGDPTEDQASAARITAKRAIHVNLRNVAGTELGTAADPVEVCLRDASGNAIGSSATYPLHIEIGPRAHVRVSKTVTYGASETGTTIWDPTAGKAFVITDIMVNVGATGAGAVTIFDETNASGSIVWKGILANNQDILYAFVTPWQSAAADNILKYTTGAGAVGDITIHGYEITP